MNDRLANHPSLLAVLGYIEKEYSLIKAGKLSHPSLLNVLGYIEGARIDHDLPLLARTLAVKAGITWSMDPSAGAAQMAAVADLILSSAMTFTGREPDLSHSPSFAGWDLDLARVALVGRPDRAAVVRDRLVDPVTGSRLVGRTDGRGLDRRLVDVHNLARLIAAGGGPVTLIHAPRPGIAEALAENKVLSEIKVRRAAKRDVARVRRLGNRYYTVPEHWFPFTAHLLRLAARGRGFTIDVPTAVLD